MKTFNELKIRHRREREHYSPNLSLRVHRALSWLNKAEQCDDDDSKFIFLWIAFNAAYAQDYNQTLFCGERSYYESFLAKLIELDKEKILFNIVWTNYAHTIRIILDNEFILSSYWDYHSKKIEEKEWQKIKEKAKYIANRALEQEDTLSVLSVLFARLYTLRNQIIHGGATYGSSVNRDQLRDCTNILQKIVPVIIELMMNGKNEIWGDPVYPVVNILK